jgi:type IV secretion system protein VirD4
MAARVCLAGTAVLVALFVASTVFAYTMRLDRALGVPLYRQGWVVVYPPWAIVRWAWWWGRLFPQPFLLPAVLGLVGALLVVRGGMGSGRTAAQAHWATLGELREAGALARRGVVLGRYRARTLRYGGEAHCLYVGRTGGGKTASLVPTILEYPGSLIVFYQKQGDDGRRRDLYQLTAGARARQGTVLRLAPTEAVSAHYNPWDRVDMTQETAYREADLISHCLLPPEVVGHESGGSRHFRELATQVLTGLSLYGLSTGLATCGEDLNDLIHSDWTGVLTSMEAHDLAVVHNAAVLASRAKGEEGGSLQTTLSRALSMFNDPRVARMTRDTSFPLTTLREEGAPCTLYWCVPPSDVARLRPLSQLVLDGLTGYCRRHIGGWRHPIGVVLEEVPRLGAMRLISEDLTDSREFGMQFLLLTPTIADLTRLYGPHHNLFETCGVQLIFGLNSARVARPFAEALGEHDVETTRTTRQGGRTSTSTERRREALLDATGIKRLKRGQVLVLVEEHSLVAQQTRYYHRWGWWRASRLPVPAEEDVCGTLSA